MVFVSFSNPMTMSDRLLGAHRADQKKKLTESKGLQVLGPKRVWYVDVTEKAVEECCPGSTTQTWEAEARARWDSKETEKEGR